MPAGHRNIIAWQRAMELAANVYAVARALRQGRHYAIASQIERAAVSIPANIAEGSGRSSAAEFARFLDIAVGSLREVETLVELGFRLGAVKRETMITLATQTDEVGRVLFGLRRAVRNRKDVRRPTLATDG